MIVPTERLFLDPAQPTRQPLAPSGAPRNFASPLQVTETPRRGCMFSAHSRTAGESRLRKTAQHVWTFPSCTLRTTRRGQLFPVSSVTQLRRSLGANRLLFRGATSHAPSLPSSASFADSVCAIGPVAARVASKANCPRPGRPLRLHTRVDRERGYNGVGLQERNGTFW